MSHEREKRILIFTDLDGTLLDADTYSFQEALPALKRIRELKIPLILCSSKTRAELELYQRRLRIADPFISENGGGIFIPHGYFHHLPGELKRRGGYLVWELGTPYRQIRRKFLEVFGALNLKAVGMGDLKPQEISSLLNLSKTEAELARKREYDEPFYFPDKIRENQIKLVEREFQKNGLTLTRGGRLFHLTGDNDKGKAVRLLSRLYKDNRGEEISTIGLGDSLNDLAMLEEVDIPVVVRKKDGSYDRNIIRKLSPRSRKKLHKTRDIGPRGWNRAVLDLIN